MSPAEKKDAVLKWLAFSPFARGNVNLTELQNGLIREYPILQNQADWGSQLEKILTSLINSKYVETWESNVAYYSEIGKAPKIRTERKYTRSSATFY